MTKFRLIGGDHVEGDKTFTKGDIIESSRNLAEVFKGKFVLASAPTIVKQEEGSPNIPSPNEPDAGSTTASGSEKEPKLGVELTGAFLETRGTDFRIYKTGTEYNIVKGEARLPGMFTKAEVIAHIAANA